MIASVLTAAPKSSPDAGTPPTTPGSAVSVMNSLMRSSAATAAHALRHADAEVHDRPGPQLQGATPGDDLARVERHRLDAFQGHADLGAVGWVVNRRVGLPMVLRLGDHDAIDERARHQHLTRVE